MVDAFIVDARKVDVVTVDAFIVEYCALDPNMVLVVIVEPSSVESPMSLLNMEPVLILYRNMYAPYMN